MLDSMRERVERKFLSQNTERFEGRDALQLIIIVALNDCFELFVLLKHSWHLPQKFGLTTHVIILGCRDFYRVSER